MTNSGKIKIKPLSINQAFQGRRFKTALYKSYEQELLYTLPSLTINPSVNLSLSLVVGFSNKSSDLSNILKPFEDILCKKYGIDDHWNYEINLKKEIVKKGEEFIEFSICELD